ncbi:MAG TPA: VWA domain-containing protein, partial [Gammaproteobacteria bacterium]|nr:VWA domain-containing protein [Gammaproteobacteria bacterium]
MKRVFPVVAAAGALFMLLSASLAFAGVKPLLMEGKKSLYQRVVSKPRAVVGDKPSTVGAKLAPAFSIYYVYARKKLGIREWLQVADNTDGQNLRWIAAEQTIPWNQGLTVIFRNPLTQERVLLFKDEQSLKSLIEKNDKQRYEAYYQQAVAGKTPADSPVVAIQPDYNIDPARQFYVAPILAHEDVFLGDGQAKLLKVATVAAEGRGKPAPATGTDFRAGVVFVVDATLSMGPYIDRTREAIRKIYRQLEKSGGSGRLRFGLIAFRDNVEAVKGLDYVTRAYATLQQGGDARQFFALVDQVEPATVSSQDFREDAYAGVKAALDDIDWKGVDARYVVLVTDAGPREAGDKLGATGLSADALNKLAQRNNVSITVLHLLTPKGVDNHEQAREAYRILSNYPGVGELYYGVEAGDVEKFGKAVDVLSQQISGSVRTAMGKAGVTRQAGDESPSLDALSEKLARIGNALRIQYLKKDKQGPPSLLSAWVLDHSLRDPSRKTLDVGVLMTRNQLGDLHERLSKTLASF